MERRAPTVICSLIEKGASARGHAGYAALQWAAIAGKLATFRMLIDQGANVHRKDNLDRTLLMHAAAMGQEAIVECILALHLSLDNVAHMINEQDRYGRTALLWAAKNNQPTIAKLLLNHGAAPTLKDRGGQDALYWSEHYGNQLVSAVLQDEVGLSTELGPDMVITSAPIEPDEEELGFNLRVSYRSEKNRTTKLPTLVFVIEFCMSREGLSVAISSLV